MNSSDSVCALLQELIRIPSVNPHGEAGTTETGERRIAEWLAEYLARCGAEVELREVLPDRPNLVARWRTKTTGRPRILFAPHTDTVSVAGMTIDPFSGDLRDGKIWGRGASDTKGSMAAMLWALRTQAEQLADCAYEIWFAGLMGEEASQHGSRALSAQEHFDFVIVGEPTGLDVVHTHKASAFLNLQTTGRAAHAARPELGDNAIVKMLTVLAAVSGELAEEFARHTDPLLGASTVSIGTIRGGSKTNIIPDQCSASVDLRFIPAHFHSGIIEEIRARLQRVCPDVEVAADPSPPLYTDPAHPLVMQLRQCGARPVGAPWLCDACFFSERGMPSVAVGPGSIAQAHTKDEFIAVEDLEAGADFFTRFLKSLPVA